MILSEVAFVLKTSVSIHQKSACFLLWLECGLSPPKVSLRPGPQSSLERQRVL
jgi:hypothetical protein